MSLESSLTSKLEKKIKNSLSLSLSLFEALSSPVSLLWLISSFIISLFWCVCMAGTNSLNKTKWISCAWLVLFFYFLNLVYMEGSEEDIINLSRHLIIIFAMLLCLLWLNNTKSFYQSILRFIIQFFFKLFRLFFICQKNTQERKKIKIEKNDFFIFNLCENFLNWIMMLLRNLARWL